jgi:hypothetical protein
MAIVNGITQSALTADLRMANVISQEVRLLLRDVNNLRNSPYIDFVGSINGLGSDTIRVAKAGLDGRDVFSVISPEDTALSANTALTKASVDCVVQRAGLRYQITDLASMTAYNAGGNNVTAAFQGLSQALFIQSNLQSCKTTYATKAIASLAIALLPLTLFQPKALGSLVASSTLTCTQALM